MNVELRSVFWILMQIFQATGQSHCSGYNVDFISIYWVFGRGHDVDVSTRYLKNCKHSLCSTWVILSFSSDAMPALNRAKCRNVHIYHGASNEILGGMRQNGSITEAVFLKILNDILLVTNEPFKVVQRSSGCTIMAWQLRRSFQG